MSHSSLSNLAKQERIRREIIAQCDHLQPLPDVIARVLRLIEDPDTEPPELERHLSTDPVLVGKILGLVNTPFYGLNRRVTSIADAVVAIGFLGIRSVVLAASVASYYQRDYGVYGHTEKGLWAHSVAVASAARTIATVAGRSPREREELFVIGLLHDIGKMMTMPYLEREYDVPEADLSAFERRVLGADHGVVGSWITAKWNLGTELSELLEHHHDAAQRPGDEFAAVLRLADDVAHALGVGYEPGRAPDPRFAHEDLHLLGMSDEWDDRCGEILEAVEIGASLSGLT